MCFTFDNGLRRLVQNPDQIIKPYVHCGDVVLDVGPGIGYFTIPMAKLVGDSGRVIAADLQESMLHGIAKRARRAGMEQRIVLRRASNESLNVGGTMDFALVFWMAHEVPDLKNFMDQLFDVLKEGGRLLIAEPKIHVSQKQFQKEMDIARSAGFVLIDQPAIPLSLSALFCRQ
jgi:ubiquinone/menaquinone biosynthesis C-methylase UbiE